MNRKDRLKKKAKDAEHKEQLRIQHVRARVPLTIIGAETRSCGECQACCDVIAVKTLHPPKANYEHCQHQCERGCGVYSHRPKECKDYRCLWQAGLLTSEEHRPDKLGVLLDERVIQETGQPCVVIWEVRPGAWEEPAVKELVKFLRQRGIRLMMNEYGNVGDGDTIRQPIL